MSQDSQLLKGVLEGCIMQLIKDEPAYGYLIVEKLKAAGFSTTQEATVYPILTRLQKKGLLHFEKRPSEVGPPRKYYFLTDEGKDNLANFIQNYNELTQNVNSVFKEGSNE